MELEPQDSHQDNNLDLERETNECKQLLNKSNNNHLVNNKTNILKHNTYESSSGPESLDNTLMHLNIMRERLLTLAGQHVMHKSDMRNYCDKLVKIS